LHALFKACDIDGDGRLNKQELQTFMVASSSSARNLDDAEAGKAKAHGTPAAWAAREAALREQVAAVIDKGISIGPKLFVRLVEGNDEQPGVGLSDSDLLAILYAAEECADSTSALAEALYSALATDGSTGNAVGPGRFLLFTFSAGFDSSDAEWGHDFGDLCEEHGVDPGTGVPKVVFLRFVEEMANRGRYCQRDKLRKALDDLTAGLGVAVSPGTGGSGRVPRASALLLSS